MTMTVSAAWLRRFLRPLTRDDSVVSQHISLSVNSRMISDKHSTFFAFGLWARGSTCNLLADFSTILSTCDLNDMRHCPSHCYNCGAVALCQHEAPFLWEAGSSGKLNLHVPVKVYCAASSVFFKARNSSVTMP